jgi:hypothetical protein
MAAAISAPALPGPARRQDELERRLAAKPRTSRRAAPVGDDDATRSGYGGDARSGANKFFGLEFRSAVERDLQRSTP